MKAKARIISLLACSISLVLAASLIGCAKKPKLVGDDYFGYLAIPSNWIEQRDSTAGFEMVQYVDPNKSAVITIMVYTAVDLDGALANMESLFAIIKYENYEESVISLDSGSLTPVYKISFFYTDFDRDIVIYLFEGPDGLTRYVSVEGTSQQVQEGADIIESSYAFSN